MLHFSNPYRDHTYQSHHVPSIGFGWEAKLSGNNASKCIWYRIPFLMQVLPFLLSLRITANWSWAVRGMEKRSQRERLVDWKLYFSARMIQWFSQVSNFVTPKERHVLARCILLSTACSCKLVFLKSFCKDQGKCIGNSLILGRAGELNKPSTLKMR